MELKDRVADIAKYTKKVDEAAVGAIVKHLGIALRNRDSSLVSGTDPEELKRVRESWCKKKLGITETDDEIDAAVKTVIDKMKADRTKERVTVYYLLAEKYGKLNDLQSAKKA
jgi:3-dehydroquinate synthetase